MQPPLGGAATAWAAAALSARACRLPSLRIARERSGAQGSVAARGNAAVVAAAAAAAARAGGLIRTGRSDRLGGRRRSRRKLSIYVQKPPAAFVVAQCAPVKRMDVLAPAEGLHGADRRIRARYSDFAICSCGGVSQICQWYRVCDAGALRAEPLATLLSCAVKNPCAQTGNSSEPKQRRDAPLHRDAPRHHRHHDVAADGRRPRHRAPALQRRRDPCLACSNVAIWP